MRDLLQEPTITVFGKHFIIHQTFAIKEQIKTIPGRAWNPSKKAWVVPANEESLRALLSIAPEAVVAPAVKELLAERKAKLEVISAQKAVPWQEQFPVRPMPILVKPFQHQIAAFNVVGTIFGLWGELSKDAGAGLYMEQGTGKTLSAIAVAGRMFLDGHISRMLVVAPASVVPVWPKEFNDFADFPYDVQALEGSSSKRASLLQKWPTSEDMLQIAVVNYESVWRIDEAVRKWKPQLIVLDESQRIKNAGAKQSKSIHKLGRAVPFRLILTGTPVSQGPLDFFSQLKFADPTILGSSYYAVKARYAILGGFENRQIIGYKDLADYTKKVHSIGFRVTKAEALDLPEQLPPQLRYCEFEKNAKTIYSQLVKTSVTQLENEKVVITQNALSKLLRLSQLAGGFYAEEGEKPVEVSKAKLNLLEETLDDLGPQKVVIFARFLAEIAAIKKLLEKKGIKYRHIDGSVPPSDRGEVVRDFQENPECQVFLAQIQTAGLGITLHASSVAIFYSMDYSYANLEQAMARLHRIGQKNPVTNIFLLTKGTVDEKVMKALESKQDVAKLVVDNWKMLFEEGVR